jgi:Domain of unknown function (DUF4290)
MKKNRNAPLDMVYNSSLEELIMPEYGRNVQQLVRHAQRIENRAERQQFCEQIIDLIQQLYPQSKAIEDYRDKLWRHLFHIADYKIEVATPTGEVPRPEDAKKRPDRVPYPQKEMRYRHYGNNLQKLINRATDMEKGPIKDGFVQTIGAYMKLAYRTWNREHYVGDEIIKTDLEKMSNGALSLEENTRIDNLSNASRGRSSSSNDKNNNNKSGNNKSSNSSSSNNRSGNNRSSNNNNSSNSNNKTGNNNNRNSNSNSSSNNNRNNNSKSNNSSNNMKRK